MSKKNIIKISQDAIMTLILVLLYNSHVFSITFHEIAGLIIAGMFVIHCLRNRKWISSASTRFFSKSLAPRVRFEYVINFLLLITFIVVIISGIMNSQMLFPDIAAPKGSPWRNIHHFSAAISIILVGTHLGLHWDFLMRMFKRIIKIPRNASRPFGIILLAIILAFGVYSIGTSSFVTWLVDPFRSASGQENNQKVAENVIRERTQDNLSNSGDHTPKDDENKVGTNLGSIENEGDIDNHPIGEKKIEGSSPAVIANTIATYLSIFSIFAAIAYYFDKLLLKKRKKASSKS